MRSASQPAPPGDHDDPAATKAPAAEEPRVRGFLARWWPLAVPLVAVTELVAHVAFAHRAPTPAQWEKVKPAAQAWHKPGELVVIAPAWSEPLARWKWGDEFFPIRDVARPDTSRYGEALEVSMMGARAPELTDWTLVRETKSGPFTLREMKNPAAAAVTFDFTEHLTAASAEVETQKGASVTACPFTDSAPLESGGLGGPPAFPASRFRCPGEPEAVFAGLTVVEDEHYQMRQCVWTQAPSGGELVTRYHKVPLGTVIRGHTGRRWLIERYAQAPTSTLRVLVDGREVGKVSHRDGQGWALFELPLGEAAHQTADVEFRSSGNGYTCFEADSR